MEEYNSQLLNVNYNTYTKHSYTKKKGNTWTKYCDDILTFDIEVTSAWLKDGKVIPYTPGKSADYWNNLEPIALSYIWQFSFNDNVYYGRELRDFEKVLKDIPEDIKVVIWVHNLSYEFHFLCNFLEWENVFAKSPHKPMKCTPIKYPNIEFRCSYMLTRLSLRTWGNELGTYKDSPIDYEKIRTPLTKLTEEEMHYCEQDCLVVYNGIKTYLNKYKHIRDIPLTQTGIVRKVVKDMLTSDKDYLKFIKGLIPSSAEEYQMLMTVFAGGYTHANKAYSGRVQKGIIEHYDFASSYPTVMVSEKYPMTKWFDISHQNFPGEDTFKDFAYIFTIEFTDLVCETANTYIQESKCYGSGFVRDNGRIVKADKLTMTMTEQDYLTIKESYSWKRKKVKEMYASRKDYLPRPFVDYILDLYKNKTELKGVEGKEEIYMQSKQYINSMFGMCVTAIIQTNVIFSNNEWKIEDLTKEMVEERLNNLHGKSAKERRYFLSYSWGCWVTAYARRNLWKCILKDDLDIIYCDTDSIFIKGKHDYTWYNNEITNKLKIACEEQNIDFNKTRPKTVKGIEKPLGVFEKEDSCKEFITLGAKRYVERRTSDNKLHLTVSGINKEAVAMLDNDISNFKDGFDFDKDNPNVNKQLCIYTHTIPKVIYPDGYVSTYNCGINLRRNGYLLTISNDYKALLELFNTSIDVLSESFFNKLRKTF